MVKIMLSTLSLGTSYGETEGIYLLVFIALILFLRLRRSVKGQKFKLSRVIYYPILYLVISIYSYYLDQSSFVLGLFLILLMFGTLIGNKIGGNVKFFNKDEKIYYKRSNYISAIWTVSFISRIILEFYYPQNFEINSIITLVLSFTTGLLIGEGINIYKAYKIHKLGIQKQKSDRQTF
jgi:membrane protein CcdC involved in cytochrome C biogenesis